MKAALFETASEAKTAKRLYLINPVNPLAMNKMRAERFSKYRIWKPLGLLTVAGLTPPGWEVSVMDENLRTFDYENLPRPDLVGITAFTSQANRAYELAASFRAKGIPTVMGGIHASMCPDEAGIHFDSIVIGEAEGVWVGLLEDLESGRLKPSYHAERVNMDLVPHAAHHLLPEGYAFGAIQTTRGCPLRCSFCSVTAFNGSRYRQRPIGNIVEEMRKIPEKYVLVVDDNIVGARPDHMERAKALFRAMIDADVRKTWISQVTVNIADDDELLALAAASGCFALFIGFESTTEAGLDEVGKRFNTNRGRDLRAAVRRIQSHGILVIGSFIMGLDSDGLNQHP